MLSSDQMYHIKDIDALKKNAALEHFFYDRDVKEVSQEAVGENTYTMRTCRNSHSKSKPDRQIVSF